MSTVTGYAEPVEQPSEREYQEGVGWSTIRVWEGERNAVDQLMAALSGQFTNLRTQAITNTVSRLYASKPDSDDGSGNQQTETIWEFLANPVEKDIFESDAFSAFDEDHRRMIKAAAQNPDPTTSPALTDADAIAFYTDLILKGSDSSKSAQPMVRKSVTVASNYDQQTSLANVGKIIPAYNFVDWEGVPTDFRGPFPPEGEARTNYTWGWYKHHPHITRNGFGKYNITQEWEWGLWADMLYKTGTAPS